jgi:lysozyme family protein
MKDSFQRCLAEVLRHEGGWADHPSDPGGATMKGITIGTYAQWKGRKVTKAELRAITDAEVAAIYRRNYWDKVRGDDLPLGLDLVAFDAAVNSGPSRGAKWLQAGLGVVQDGQIGPVTLAAASSADRAVAINRACDARLAFLKRLKTWPTFGRGWTRRVEEIRVDAQRMATRTAPTAPTRPAAPVSPAQPTLPPAASASPLVAFIQAIVAAIAALFRRN